MILKVNKKIICKDLKYCQSFIDRSLGLLRKSNPRNLLFKTRFGIHTFFIKEPIDVLILDSKYRIKDFRQDLNPNRLFFWNLLYTLVIELKAGTIKKFNLKKDQVMEIN